MAKEVFTPRGLRNNNPLNIRIGNVWLGEVHNPTDPEFEQFVTIQYGLRAAFVILRRYIRRYHHNTIATIISHWAPSTENNTQRYVDHVTKRMQMAPDVPILYEDEDTMCQLVQAMAIEEVGKTIGLDIIHKSYNMA